ncbi:Hypothetical predicted protein, partial [Pelobates cultripes]
MNELEQSNLAVDAFESSNYDTSFLSEGDSYYNNAINKEEKPTKSKVEDTFLVGRGDELYSNFQPINKLVSKVSPQEIVSPRNDKVFESPEGKPYMDKYIQNCDGTSQSHQVICETLGQKLPLNPTGDSMFMEGSSGLLMQNIKEKEEMHTEGKPVREFVPSFDHFEDSGITEDQMFASSELFFDDKISSADEEPNKYFTCTSEELIILDSSSSDLNDDTSLSIRSGSYYSLRSNSSSPIFIDGQTDLELSYFEEEDFPDYSKVIRNTISKAVNTDMPTVDPPCLPQLKTAQRRDVSSNTELSCLIRHEKGCQTDGLDTQDLVANADISISELFSNTQ